MVADALNCQTETAPKIIENSRDYLLSAKDNQSKLKSEISDFVADLKLRKNIDLATKKEKNRERYETRIAYTTCEIDWLFGKKWQNLTCIGAINTQFKTSYSTSNEWHYDIFRRKLSAEKLLDLFGNWIFMSKYDLIISVMKIDKI